MLARSPEIYIKYLITVILILTFAQVFVPLTTYFKLSSINERIVDEVEWQGEINGNVTGFLSSLCVGYGVNPKVTWSGNFVPSSRGTNLIQLREPFTLELEQEIEIKFLDLSGNNPLTLKVPVKTKGSGKSEVFWRSGEM